jgi:glutaredoxin
MGESAPEWQCPSCGIAYAKAGAQAAAHRQRNGGASSLPVSIGRFLLAVIFVAGLAWAFVPGLRPAPATPAEVAQARIVMYSLTTCGYCNIKRKELRARGIPFVEYFVDTDPARRDELFAKLRDSGFRGGAFGTPTFEVNGRMLPNNPSIETILRNI